jgi:predicted sulfurtransferase
MISQQQLLAELSALQQQKNVFIEARNEAQARITRTEGAIEMTLIFLRRLQEAAEADQKKAEEIQMNEAIAKHLPVCESDQESANDKSFENDDRDPPRDADCCLKADDKTTH